MKSNVLNYEEFLNETVNEKESFKIEMNKNEMFFIDATNKDEVMCSNDNETKDQIITALENIKKSNDKRTWYSIESKDGDLLIQRQPKENQFTIQQVEDIVNEDDYTTIFININMIDKIIQMLKKK